MLEWTAQQIELFGGDKPIMPLEINQRLNGDYIIKREDMPFGPPLDICPGCLLEEITDRVDGDDPEYGLLYRLVLPGRYCQSFRHSEV